MTLVTGLEWAEWKVQDNDSKFAQERLLLAVNIK